MKQIVQIFEPCDQPLVIVGTFLPFESPQADEGWELDDLTIHPLVDGQVLAALPLSDDHLLAAKAGEMVLQVLAASLNA